MALVYLLSFLSGIAALIYEVEWFQMLELVTGSTAQSIAMVLAGFMGGLCLGSLFVPSALSRLSARAVYAFAELGIAVLAFAMLAWGMRSEWAAVLLIAPAILMGATLPALASTGARVAWLYAANVLGAVVG